MGEKIESEVENVLLKDIDQQISVIQDVEEEETSIFQDIVSNLKNTGHEISRRHKQGVLPIQIFAFTIIYNFIFFQSEEGKELYVLIPLILGGLTYWLKYWENPKKTSFYISSSSLFLGLSWDLILSISFIPTYENWGYNLDTFPTLIADILALFSAILWFTNKNDAIFDS